MNTNAEPGNAPGAAEDTPASVEYAPALGLADVPPAHRLDDSERDMAGAFCDGDWARYVATRDRRRLRRQRAEVWLPQFATAALQGLLRYDTHPDPELARKAWAVAQRMLDAWSDE